MGSRLCLERGDIDGALTDLTLVLKEKPAFRPAYFARAKARFAREEEGPGIEDVNEFLRPSFDRRDAKFYAKRGQLLNAMPGPKASEAALRDLRKAKELGDRSPDLFNALGDVLLSQGQPAEAIEEYSRGLDFAPRDVRLLTNRGMAILFSKAKDKFDKAAKAFNDAIEVDPGTAFERLVVAYAHAGLGYVYACTGETTKALEEATRATLAVRTVKGDIVLYANHFRLRHNLACIYGELSRCGDEYQKDHEKLAVDYLREAVALAKRMGMIDEERGNIEIEPAFPPALKNRRDFQDLLKNAR
jgi:tetratricopeptide (TPR) repeat protein